MRNYAHESWSSKTLIACCDTSFSSRWTSGLSRSLKACMTEEKEFEACWSSSSLAGAQSLRCLYLASTATMPRRSRDTLMVMKTIETHTQQCRSLALTSRAVVTVSQVSQC